jgi:uncharacterized protein (DUF1499 family)
MAKLVFGLLPGETISSMILRFIDDVEFYFDEATGFIEFRSASRLGYGDAGANRQRMETFR